MLAYLLKLFFLHLLPFFSCYSSTKISRLYAENFEDNVFLDNDPWIIGIDNRISFDAIERIYDQVKDRIKVGVIEQQEFSSYLQEQEGKDRIISSGAFRVYPFGPKIHKRLNWVDAQSEEIAISKALNSIPDITNKLPNTVDNKNTMLRDFIQQAYSTIPVKFPVILFTDKRMVPQFYKLLALKFSLLFHFGVIENAPPGTLAVFNIFKVPIMVALLTEILSDGTPRIRPIPYNENIQGQLTYPTAMRFLYLVHKTFFHDLLKQAHTSVPDDFNIDEIFQSHFHHFPELLQLPSGTNSDNHKSERGDKKNEPKAFNCDDLDVCMILVDKDLQNENQILNEIATSLTGIKDKIIHQDKSVEIFKVDLNCNEELELAFDIYVMDLPVLLILRPKKHIYTMAVVKELSVSVDDFIGQALLGKVAHLKFKKLPELNVGSCNTILHTNKESPNDKKKIRFEL